MRHQAFKREYCASCIRRSCFSARHDQRQEHKDFVQDAVALMREWWDLDKSTRGEIRYADPPARNSVLRAFMHTAHPHAYATAQTLCGMLDKIAPGWDAEQPEAETRFDRWLDDVAPKAAE